MTHADQFDQALALFLRQHAMLHTAKIWQNPIWSYEDALLDDMVDEQIRHISKDGEHSIAWCFWHMARVEDVTMNLLVAGSDQVLHRDNWLAQLMTPFQKKQATRFPSLK